MKTIDDLKFRDKVECLYPISQQWVERTFLHKGFDDDTIICVAASSDKDFRNGFGYETIKWDEGKWRIPKEKEYIPYTVEDDLLGVKVRCKKDIDETAIIIGKSNLGVAVGVNGFYRYQEFLEYWTHFDGTPCGKLKEDEEIL
jgi:hypothetical protein